MPEDDGTSYVISLKNIDCSEEYFNRAIKPVILGLRDLINECLVVEEVSSNIDFIQTVFEKGTLHRVEVKTFDNKFMSSNGYTKEQAVAMFRKACVEKKRFEDLNNYENGWRDFQKEEHCKIIAEDLEDKELTSDEEALYLEALDYLVRVWKDKRALEALIGYYRKIENDELFDLYSKMLKEK